MQTTLHLLLTPQKGSGNPLPFEQLLLRIYRKHLFTQELWTEYPIGPNGRLEEVLIDEAGGPYNLLLELVYAAPDGEAVVLEQRGPFCPGEAISATFTVDTKAFGVWYEQLDGRIRAELGDHPVEEVEAGQWQQLACLIGVEADQVQAWRQAQQWAEETQSYEAHPRMETEEAAPVLFALLPSGDTRSLAHLLMRSEAQFRAALEQAESEQHIQLDNRNKAVKWLVSLREAKLFAPEATDQPGPAALLALLSLDAGRKNELLDALLENGSLQALLATEEEVPEQEALQRLHQLDQIAQQHLPMVG
ncbi:MAG: hypothetical protein KDD02_06620, partial [Phaeodactylibacter sp.]|nr:hypothetical protein [Phaeodactylibacter sp.]